MFDHNKRLFWATVVILLFIGALSPVFRNDEVADYVGFGSSLMLAGLFSG
jgi:hypothetical protein